MEKLSHEVWICLLWINLGQFIFACYYWFLKLNHQDKTESNETHWDLRATFLPLLPILFVLTHNAVQLSTVTLNHNLSAQGATLARFWFHPQTQVHLRKRAHLWWREKEERKVVSGSANAGLHARKQFHSSLFMSVVVVCKVVLISLQSFVLRLAVDLLCMQSCTFASTKLASHKQKVPLCVCVLATDVCRLS